MQAFLWAAQQSSHEETPVQHGEQNDDGNGTGCHAPQPRHPVHLGGVPLVLLRLVPQLAGDAAGRCTGVGGASSGVQGGGGVAGTYSPASRLYPAPLADCAA